jgi:hypothetical protein
MYTQPPMFWLHELPHSNSSSQQFSKRSFSPSATYSTNFNTIHKDRDRDITVGIANRYGLDGSGFVAGGSKRFSLLHTRPDPPVGLPSFPYKGYRGSFRRVKQPRCVALSIHRNLAQRLRMSEAIPLLPYLVCMACCGDIFTFTCMQTYIHT